MTPDPVAAKLAEVDRAALETALTVDGVMFKQAFAASRAKAVLITALEAALRREERLREALTDAIYTVQSGRRGSIGSIGNVYLPQVDVVQVERWCAALTEETP